MAKNLIRLERNLSKEFYFGGCSFTYGQDLKDTKGTRYSRLVSDYFDATDVNQSLRGGSNQQIVRKFNTYVSQSKPDFVSIMWSQASRFEAISLTSDHRYTLEPPYQQVHSRWVQRNLDLNRHEAVDFIKDSEIAEAYEHFYFKIYTDEYQILNWLNQILTIQNYCKSNSIPYLMSCAFSTNWMYYLDMIHHNSSLISNEAMMYFNLIDWDCWIEGGTWSFRTHLDNNNIPMSKDLHPLEEGHRAAADIIIEYIETLYGNNI